MNFTSQHGDHLIEDADAMIMISTAPFIWETDMHGKHSRNIGPFEALVFNRH